MADQRVEQMARVLVHYSLKIQPGERVGIKSGPLAIPLLRALTQEIIRAGGHPEIFMQPAEVQEILLREGSAEQLSRVPAGWNMVISEFETLIDIQAQENTKALSTIPPDRKALQNQAQGTLLQTLIKRSLHGTLRWTNTLFPTHAYAQDTGLSLSEFEDLFYRACFLEDTDPLSRWRQLSQEQERYIAWLHGKQMVHLKGKETDLTFSIAGRPFLNEDGRGNFPGGEIFASPVENSANGTILFNMPSIYKGQEVQQVWLRFVDGRVAEFRAQSGQEYLEHMLHLDEGARRLGEFAFGNNPYVQQCTRNVLIDEKMARTIHFALGASIPGTQGTNQSSLHWDMVYDLKPGSEIYIDHTLFCKNGQITI